MTRTLSRPTAAEAQHQPVRVSVFSTFEAADKAVERLLAAGFTAEEILVISSDEGIQEYFGRFHHQDPSGANTPVAAAAGGAIGAAMGAMGTAAAVAATGMSTLGGGAAVLMTLAGGPVIWAGVVLGGFVGAMMTRGIEKETADFYDQSVTAGKILVGVEIHSASPAKRLEEAGKILAECGAEPIPLREG